MNLQGIIKKIKKEGEHRGYEFICERTLNVSTFVLANKRTEKAILLGEDREKTIKCYSININKWLWAENEGFSKDEIVNDLYDEIFKIIKIKNPIDNSQIAKISRLLM